jgi:hypothetical protein
MTPLDGVPVLKSGLDRKTAMIYARGYRRAGKTVYARKRKDGWAVFDKGAYNEANRGESK